MKFYTLPETAGLDVPVLLPVGNLGVVDSFHHGVRLHSWIDYAYDDLILAYVDLGGNVKFEG
jgi:hypothetical protein